MLGLEDLGRWLMGAGVVLLVVGGIVMLLGRLGQTWPLPGDVVIRRENVTFYFPWVTAIIVSIVLSVLLTVAANLFLRR